MAATIDELQVEIQASSSDASKGIGALVASLNKLKKAVDIKGAASLNKNLKDLQDATSQLSVGTGNKISSLAKGLRELSEVPKAQISAALAKQIVSIGTAVRLVKDIDFAPLNQLATGLNLISSVKKPEVTLTTAQHIEALGNSVRSLKDADFGLVTELANALRSFENIKKSNLGETLNQLKKVPEIINSISSANINAFSVGITQLVDALIPLSEIEKSNLGSVLNQLKKIPEITKALSSRELAKFGLQIRLVTKYIQPLATEMEKVSRGFSALPARVQKVINANARLSKSNTKTAFSFNMMAMRIGILFTAARRLAYVVSAWINESSAYVENLNLFAVSMGNAADAAKNYAETVGELLGIDPSDWMRNQGVFMTLLTGFGVVEDKAALMSKQLTQLGYDISSYFNISVFEAMQKLQSGIAGELEPLRRIGYDLSQAKLQATALALGIEKNVSEMTQAEKAYLRYYAILTQVTTVQGDMARTLESPNNQMRILQAQLVQLCRALGNVFIPLLNKILPYAIAFVRVLRDIANTIGVIVGFELPEFDYSGVGQIGNDADEAADAFDELDKNAKKLTKTLLKFDELNVINSGDLTDAVEDIKDIVNIDLPTYDFLSELSENKISEIVQEMKKWLGLTENISSWSDLMDTKFGSILKTVGAIAGAIALWKVADSFMNAINLLSKFNANKVIGLTLGIAGVTLLFDGIKEIFDESPDNDLMGAVKSAIGAALSGAALTTMWGEGLSFSVEIALWFAAVSLLFTGIEYLTDSSPENDLLGAVTAGLGAALMGTLLSLMAGKGLMYSVGVGLAVASLAILFDSIKKLVDDSANNDLFAAVESGIGSALGGAVLQYFGLVDNGLKFGFNLWLGIMAFKVLTDGLKDLTQANSLKEKIMDALKIALGAFAAAASIGVSGTTLLMTIPLTIAFSITYDFATNGGLDRLKNSVNQAINKNKIKEDDNVFDAIGKSVQAIVDFGKNLLNPHKNPVLKGGRALLKANGGFVDSGQLFIAREAGPEMVGTIGRRTAVANNDQIVEGISDGVYAAVVAALRDSNYGDSAPFVIELDSDPIYKGVVNRARREFARTGQTGLVY